MLDRQRKRTRTGGKMRLIDADKAKIKIMELEDRRIEPAWFDGIETACEPVL